MYCKSNSRIARYVLYCMHQIGALWHTCALLLFPAFCTYCKDLLSARNALCAHCAQAIKPLASIKLTLTQKYQMPIYAVGAYQEPLRQLILAKSYQDKLACYYMAQLMFKQVSGHLQADYLVPIPLHWTRYAKRGYNQSCEIAHYLSGWSGIPILHALKRTKRTPFQSQFNKEGRQENLCDAFILNLSDQQLKELRYKQFILVDDVMTTGATLHAAGRRLLPLKPLGIKGMVLARTCQN